eukprot:m.179915 g.179915  ORF g.179915 m.179915 type:complete len:112 (+) comp18401_c0_seq10:76-411(+)
MMLVIQMAMLICLRMCHQIDVLLLRLDVQNVYMKISMICYTDAKFDESEVVHSALQRVISIFGYHCHTRVILNRTFSRQEGHVRDTTQKPQPVSLKLDNTSQSVSYKISFK